MTCAQMQELAAAYGDAFYLLHSKRFRENFRELEAAFTAFYPNFAIAYSYKTNYTPKLCKIVNDLGGFAEVVSDMELEVALRAGVKPEKIIWNGPFKNAGKVEELLVLGGTVHLDSKEEFPLVRAVAARHPETPLRLGIRCNFEIGDGVLSRFGFDVDGEDFKAAVRLVSEIPNLVFTTLQCHFATRNLKTFPPRVEKMLALFDSLAIRPERLDLGGGIYGKMPPSLKAQFDCEIPSYRDYAEVVAPAFAAHFQNAEKKPLLVLEPGTALVGDCMQFAARVVSIKSIRGKAIATVLGSVYNINPTLNQKNPPVEIVPMGGEQAEFADLDFGGYTCIESDYLYRHYKGKLAVGDMALFGNAGSYSVVLKPPFILPNFPVLDLSDGKVEVIKRGETFDDLFHTYSF